MVEGRQFAEVATAATALLAEVPENRDVLYLLAVSQRYLGRIADALRTLEGFASLHPDYGRLFQERGHCLRAVGEAGPAIAAYQQAVALNQTLSASWSALQGLYTSIGDETNMDTVASWDSIKHMNLVLAIEEEFGISIPDEDAANITSYPLIKLVLQDLLKDGSA